MNTAQAVLAESTAGQEFVSKVLPATVGVAVAAVFVAYLFMTCSSGGTPFGKLKKEDHVWAWFSVGFKTFDLATDWGFFFNSVRGATFESVYRFVGHSETATRPPAERRYDPNVVAFQFAVMFFCTVATMLTFADFYGSYSRLHRAVGDGAKVSFRITFSVILFEDIPQLVFVGIYLSTIMNANIVSTIDTMAIVSLVASVLNILFQIFLLCKDSKAAKRKDAVKEPTGTVSTQQISNPMYGFGDTDTADEHVGTNL